MSDSIRPTRKNGLSPPYTPAQLSTWVFLPTLVVEYLLVVSPLLPLAVSIPCSVVFCSMAGFSVGYAYKAMKTDPSDPRLVHHREQNNNNQCETVESGRNTNWDPQDPTKQCWLCDIQVGVKSMHCKFCNKCVDHFDHHCMCTFFGVTTTVASIAIQSRNKKVPTSTSLLNKTRSVSLLL
jgi:palmitoyltransferase